VKKNILVTEQAQPANLSSIFKGKVIDEIAGLTIDPTKKRNGVKVYMTPANLKGMTMLSPIKFDPPKDVVVMRNYLRVGEKETLTILVGSPELIGLQGNEGLLDHLVESFEAMNERPDTLVMLGLGDTVAIAQYGKNTPWQTLEEYLPFAVNAKTNTVYAFGLQNGSTKKDIFAGAWNETKSQLSWKRIAKTKGALHGAGRALHSEGRVMVDVAFSGGESRMLTIEHNGKTDWDKSRGDRAMIAPIHSYNRQGESTGVFGIIAKDVDNNAFYVPQGEFTPREQQLIGTNV